MKLAKNLIIIILNFFHQDYAIAIKYHNLIFVII